MTHELHIGRGVLRPGDRFWTIRNGTATCHTCDRFIVDGRDDLQTPSPKILSGSQYFSPHEVYLDAHQCLLESELRLRNMIAWHRSEIESGEADLLAVRQARMMHDAGSGVIVPDQASG